MKAPVGLLSDRTVLHSKMERLCPDKFQFAVLVPSRVWGRHAPTRKLSRRGTTFSRIENLWSRDGSCSLHFWHFGERCFTMDIEIKRMSSDTIELFDRLNIKRQVLRRSCCPA